MGGKTLVVKGWNKIFQFILHALQFFFVKVNFGQPLAYGFFNGHFRG